MCIAEGDVSRVGCPDPECVKEKREADAQEVARIVTEAEMERWRWLKEKKNLEAGKLRNEYLHCLQKMANAHRRSFDRTLSYGFLPNCNLQANRCGWGLWLEQTQAMSGMFIFILCILSTYMVRIIVRLRYLSLTLFCRHGPITPCPIAHSEKLVLDYLNCPEESKERQFIEKRFGRSNVLKLVATYHEEQANKEWLESSTMACPGCEVHVEKSLGCNHVCMSFCFRYLGWRAPQMICTKCHQHFCYRCGTRLTPGNPYEHFSNTSGNCYNKLFDFQDGEDEWQPVEGFDT